MTVNVSSVVAAYANAGKMTEVGGAASGASSGGGFGDVLRSAAEGVLDSLHKGEQATIQAVTGKADLTQVTAAINNAEVALQSVTAIRDKMVQAYQSIIQMPI